MNLQRKIRLAYFVSHPIQYQAPLLRQIAAQPDIDLTVYFTSDHSVRSYFDQGFGVNVAWDTPLLDGYKYEFLPKGFFRNARFDRQISAGIIRRLRQNAYDAVWLHGYNSLDSLQALFASRILGLPVLLRSESNLYDRERSSGKLLLKDVFFRILRQTVAGVLACGSANRKYWQHYLGDNFPIFDMPYTVDNEFFQREAGKAAPRREEFRAELGLEPGRPIILYASKLQPRKRCIDLVEAFLRLPRSPDDRKPYLLLIGDGEERPAVEQRAAGNPDIKLLGFRNQSELPRFFDLCDVFVLPSIYEPWGLVVNEAMNAGRAMIVSDQVGCQPDLVFDGLNGCVFKALNVDALTGALSRVLSSTVEFERMGQESLRLINGCGFARDIAGLRAALHSVVSTRNFPATEPSKPGAESSA